MHSTLLTRGRFYLFFILLLIIAGTLLSLRYMALQQAVAEGPATPTSLRGTRFTKAAEEARAQAEYSAQQVELTKQEMAIRKAAEARNAQPSATTASPSRVLVLNAHETAAVLATPFMSSFKKNCVESEKKALRQLNQQRMALGTYLVDRISVDGKNYTLFTARPSCFNGDYEMSDEGWSQWIRSSDERYYDAALFISDGVTAHFLGKSCEERTGESQRDDAECSHTVGKPFVLPASSLPAVIITTKWTGVDAGGEYQDVYYSSSDGSSWFWYPAPDSARIRHKELCQFREVAPIRPGGGSSAGDLEIREHISETDLRLDEVGGCYHPEFEGTFSEVDLRKIVFLGPGEPKITTQFMYGQAIVRQASRAVDDLADTKHSVLLSSSTRVRLISRLFSKERVPYWRIEAPSRKSGYLREEDIRMDPTLIGADKIAFDAVSEPLRSKWVATKDGGYACYNEAGTLSARLSNDTGKYEKMLVSTDGKRLLSLMYEYYRKPSSSARELHLLTADGCKDLFQVPNIVEVKADPDLKLFAVWDPKWNLSFYDAIGAKIGELGVINGGELQFSPRARYVLATGSTNCTYIDKKFTCFERCATFDVERREMHRYPFATCYGKAISDSGEITSPGKRP